MMLPALPVRVTPIKLACVLVCVTALVLSLRHGRAGVGRCEIATAQGSLEAHETCLDEVDAELRLRPDVLARLDFGDPPGATELPLVGFVRPMYTPSGTPGILQGWVRQDGLVRVSPSMDGLPDGFNEGLARYIDRDGRYGYMNERLEVVVPARFAHARPFAAGVAQVCIGETGLTCAGRGVRCVCPGGAWYEIGHDGRTVRRIAEPDLRLHED
jgi:hypothetical protein